MRAHTNQLLQLMTVIATTKFSRVPQWERLTDSTKEDAQHTCARSLNKTNKTNGTSLF